MVNIYSQIATAVALGTLDSQVALKIGATYEGFSQKTLLKRTRIRAAVTGQVSGEGPLLIGMAYGELTVGTIKAALENAYTPEVGGTTAPAQQAIKRGILWESLGLIMREVGGSFNLDIYDSGDRALGGGKGLPFMENVGWQLFVYNLSGADLTGTPSISFLHDSWGVQLD